MSAVLSTAASAAQSPDGLWQDIPYQPAARAPTAQPLPSEYRLVRLDAARLDRLLARLRAGRGGDGGETLLDLPLPDGGFERLRIRPVEVMAPELAARYPRIRTFEGASLDHPDRWARLDWTPLGFHGYLRDGDQAIFVNPRTEGEPDTYLSFFRDRLPSGIDPTRFANDVRLPPNRAPQEAAPPETEARGERGFGNTFRTYRLAVAATGEYTQYHGGTVAKGLAAVTSAINRVDGIYQRELAVKLQLVANNDRIIYTDPGADPYTDNNADLLVYQNIDNLDAVIGNGNYDIGQVFATGAGGVSYKGVVCDDWYKGGGATGNSSPTGDPFWVDYVAHEIGHQFGAEHTYNSTQGSCGGERIADHAYEPGSGSTIMGYAGICGSDNLQSNSDPYFHVASLQDIRRHLDQSGGCAALSPSGNTPPLANAGPGGYVLPISTPFVLSGSGADADGDNLSYAWEEYDLGPAGSPNYPSGTAPLFRSWSPEISPNRYFPRLSDLLAGVVSYGERLPNYGRTLNFMLTVRDGKGGVDYQPIAAPITVTSSAGPFTVNQPTANATYNGGASLNISWNPANTQFAPVACTQVNIALWTPNGSQPLAAGVATIPVRLVAMPDDPALGEFREVEIVRDQELPAQFAGAELLQRCRPLRPRKRRPEAVPGAVHGDFLSREQWFAIWLHRPS